jgi:predicted nucleic acid-binding protein
VTRCVLDTDIVIGALDRRDAHHERASAVVLELIERDVPLHLSVINYAEALVKPAEDESALRRAVEAIAALRISLHAPDGAIGREAARLRGLGISLADGFALATAKHLDAGIATFDARVRAVAQAVEIGLA